MLIFFLICAGQIVVAWRAPRWLPPMEQWQSGLLPYPALLAGQAVVLTLMIWIAVDFSSAAGFWAVPRPRLGAVALWWSAAYFGAMVARYVIWMARRPDQRWLGGTIPTFVSFGHGVKLTSSMRVSGSKGNGRNQRAQRRETGVDVLRREVEAPGRRRPAMHSP